MRYGFVIDNGRCIGCHACSTACKSENEVPVGVNRTWVKYTESGRYPEVKRHFQVTRCNHCENPPCVRICPVSAMYQRDDGIVEFDSDRCIGCKACIQACPYDAIYLDPATNTAAKCHYCSHRVDIGMEPACVVVCPEHAIISGDMDDPNSEISRYLGRKPTTVRKPEQGTAPKLFYVEGHDASLVPTATNDSPTAMWSGTMPHSALENLGKKQDNHANHQGLPAGGSLQMGQRLSEHMVQVGYNAQHKLYWHWPVAAYIVTKDIAAGVILLMALCAFGNLAPVGAVESLWTTGVSLVMTLVTTAFLVGDLAKPTRFLYILTKTQWRSWLARGAFVLIAFSGLVTALFLISLGGVLGVELPDWMYQSLLMLGVPLAALTSCYTAFLFGQAEGRDFWQHPLLPIQFLVRAIMAGSATMLLVAPFAGLNSEYLNIASITFGYGVLGSLITMFLGEFAMSHASDAAARAGHDILKGRYSRIFWIGTIGMGHAVPLMLVFGSGSLASLVPAAGLVVIGLYLYEYAFVMAPQRIPNS